MPRKGTKKKARAGAATNVASRTPAKRGPRSQKRVSRQTARNVAVFPGGSTMIRPAGPRAPLATNFSIGPVTMSMSDRAQSNCDQGHCPSVRITGSDLARVSLAQNGLGAGINAVYRSSTAAYKNFGPDAISARLAALAGMYSWYAFRELELTFIPAVGPTAVGSTTAIGAADIVGVGLDTDASSVANDGPTSMGMVLELMPSTCFPAWQGGVLRYRFDGAKLWATSTNNSSNIDSLDYEQLALCGLWSTAPPTTSTYSSHIIYVRYVIDLYRPQEPTTYPSVARPPLRALRTELDKLSLRIAASEAECDLEQDEKSCGTVMVDPGSGLGGRARSLPPRRGQ